MNEQLKKAPDKIKQFWSSAPHKLKKAVIIGIAMILVVALFFSIFLNTDEYVVIFDQLAQTETVEILAKLQEMDVKVKTGGDNSIMVLKEDEARIRMALATEGYPKSGLSYYLIEKSGGMLTTDYERKQYANMQLQERIAASIKTLDGVKDAVVTITMPSEQVFYLQEKEQATASVIIHMKQGSTLSERQIAGIQNLVAKSVIGLTSDNIALIDSQGNDLVGNDTRNNPDFLKVSLTKEIENEVKRKIMTVLEGPYKYSSFKISVTATVDTDDLIKEETLYTPSIDGNNTGVISDTSKTSESSSSTQADGGIPGTGSNSEIPTYPTGGSNGESTYTSSSEETKYQVSQVKSQLQKSGAKIESISIGIAIDKASFDPGERDRITQLVAFAAGVNPEDITVQNFVFDSKEEKVDVTDFDEEKNNKRFIYISIGAGVFILLAGLLALILFRKRKRALKSAEEERTQIADEDALNELFGQEEVAHITPVSDSRAQAIKDFAKENPEIVAQMIKSWLKSDSDE
ncbi:MAG: flagellar basal-body MS-ring/collar protein FliF [Eubacteriales bacterium]|nr:flagellar basal-body MS-ring/collar protein FliF [Eubacteriales bacterium]